MNATTAELSNAPTKLDLQFRKAFLNKLSRIKDAQLTIQDPLETVVLGEPAKDGLSAKIVVKNPDFYRLIALSGSIGAAESYMDFGWEADDLTRVIQILVRNRDLLDSMEGGLAVLAGLLLKFRHFANKNSLQGSKRNIAAHYDLGNDLFSLFLDRHGMYSSATYHDLEISLEEASTAKLDRICQKLALQPDDHLLEIGSGWGGFAAYAASHYGCRITTATISKEQYLAAGQRIAEAGVSDRVEIVMEDYRNLQGRYDKLVSIEMIEAVGHQYLDTYLRRCADLLKPNGLALIQAITIEDQRYKQALKSVDFIKRYIFPGSFIPCVSAIVDSAARCTDLRLINLEDQGESYALTLKSWRERFMASLDQVRAHGYSEEFTRMWEFYLCYCEGGFLERSISNVQLLWAKPGNRRPQWLPTHGA